jgi:hypothetical protein
VNASEYLSRGRSVANEEGEGGINTNAPKLAVTIHIRQLSVLPTPGRYC